MIKQQQKLLEKLQKKAEKEADRRRKQEARCCRRDEEELRKKEGRKKIKRAKVLDYVTITSLPNCSQINVQQSAAVFIEIPSHLFWFDFQSFRACP